jgi:nitrite reductase (NADH) large subunit
MSGNGSKRVWVCLICGYVHHGPEPPEECPVCGADRSDFEAQAETVPAAPVAAAAPPKRWKCLVCGYIHEGDGPPEECPVCGADSDQFELINDGPAPVAAQGKSVRVVIVGGGIAGVSAAESARQSSANAEITLVAGETELPYYRLNLTRYLAGEIGDEALPIHPEAWYGENRIGLLRGAEAVSVSVGDSAVVLGDGTRLSYDRLIIACGAHAFIPPVPGTALPGAGALRTVADAKRILAALRPGMACVCIGGGILGLETAGALAKRGARVTVLEGGGWLLQRQLNEAAGRVLERYVGAAGIGVQFNAKTEAITGSEGVEAVRLADGTVIPAGLVVIATGVRPNTELAAAAGITVNLGTVVNACLATSAPDIFAAGDVAEHGGTLYGLWDPARHQGAIAGMNAAGVVTEFGGIPRANTLKVLGVGLFSVGMVQAADDGVVEVAEERDGGYCRFLLQDGRMAGAIFVGDTKLAAAATKAVKTGMNFPAAPGVPPTVDTVKEWLGGAAD